jgi:hypothetical protein
MTPDQKAKLNSLRTEAMTRQGDVESQEDEMYSEASPKGRFSGKVLNALVDATNRILPLFGIKEAYDRFTEPALTSLPPDFARLLTMFGKAFEDAVEEGILTPDAKIDLSIVKDDQGLQGLAGRLNMAAKNSAFKRFLAKSITEELPVEPEMSQEEPPAEEMDTETLFAGRM